VCLLASLGLCAAVDFNTHRSVAGWALFAVECALFLYGAASFPHSAVEDAYDVPIPLPEAFAAAAQNAGLLPSAPDEQMAEGKRGVPLEYATNARDLAAGDRFTPAADGDAAVLSTGQLLQRA
jgi:hypothetical protein